MEFAVEQQAAQHRYQRDGDDRRSQYRERLGEGERVKQLAFLAGQREDGNEGQQNDGHREEHRTADESGGLTHRVPDEGAVARVDRALLDVAKGVLGDDDARRSRWQCRQDS